MADRPPFRITEEIVSNKRELAERLNTLFEDLYITKEEREQFKPSQENQE